MTYVMRLRVMWYLCGLVGLGVGTYPMGLGLVFYNFLFFSYGR